MKVLIYSHYFSPSVGGVERVVETQANGLAERGERVTVVTETGAEAKEERAFPFAVIRRPGIFGLAKLLRQHDVISLAGPALLPLFLALLLRRPVAVEHHVYQAICPNGLLIYQPDRTICPGHFQAGRHRECLRCNAGLGRWTSLQMWLLAFPRLWLCRMVSANVAVTEHVNHRLRLPRCQTIYLGVAPAAMDGDKSLKGNARQDSPVCFAFVGRMVGEKGLPVLVEAAARLKREGWPFRLKFIGDGPERKRIETAIAKGDLADRAEFTGMLGPDELQKARAEATAVVMPSVWEETAGLAAMEQMMRGGVVIASDVGGLGEVVDGAGLKFPVGDSVALAERMKELIEKPELAPGIGDEARKRAESLFGKDRMIERHLELYRGFCCSTPSPHQPIGQEGKA